LTRPLFSVLIGPMSIDAKQPVNEREAEEVLDGATSGVSELAVFVNRFVKPGSPCAEQRLEALKTLIEIDVGIAIVDRRTELHDLKEGVLKRIKEGVVVMNFVELDNLQRHIAEIFGNALAKILDYEKDD
jgi:hypothetical protein